jgi:hypothetical protein
LSARHGANIRVTRGYCTCFLTLTVRVTVSARTVSVTFVITAPIDQPGTRLSICICYYMYTYIYIIHFSWARHRALLPGPAPNHPVFTYCIFITSNIVAKLLGQYICIHLYTLGICKIHMFLFGRCKIHMYIHMYLHI